MAPQCNLRLNAFLRSFSKGACTTVFLTGLLVLLGWIFDTAALKDFTISPVTMKANAAVSFIFISISIWLMQIKRSNRLKRYFEQGCIFTVLLISFLTLIEYLFRLNIGIDQLLFYESVAGFDIIFPGRMSLITALNLFLTGIALLLIEKKNLEYCRLAQILVSIVTLTSSFILLGYIYGVRPFSDIASSMRIALHTTISFIVLSAAILSLHPDRGIMAIFTGAGTGERLIRRLLGAMIFILPFLGWLRLLGERKELYNTEFGLSIHVVLSVAIFAFLIWRSAIVLDRRDTERKQIEKQLHEATQRLKLHMENSPLAVVEWDSDYRIIRWNDKAEVVFGWSSDEVLGKRIDELRWVYEEDWDKVRQVMADMLDGSRPSNVNKNRNYRKDGSVIHCEWYNSALLDTSGKLVSVLSLVLDVTERKRTEKKLQEGNRILEALMEYVPEGITIADAPDVHIRMISKYGVQLTERPREILEGIPSEAHAEKWDLFHPDGVTPATPEELPLTRATQKGEVVMDEEWIIRRPNGEKITILCSAGPIKDDNGTTTGGVIVWRDITERKRVECELKRHQEQLEELVKERTRELRVINEQLQQKIEEREQAEDILEKERQFLKAILDTIEVGIVACDFHGILTLFNRATQEFHGLPVEPLPAERWAEHYDLYLPDGVTKMKKEQIPLFRALQGETVRDVELMIIPKGGAARIMLASGQALIDRYGKKFGAVIAMHDITERKRAEKALRASENKYRLLVENLPQRIFYKDKNLSYLSCNEVAARDLHIKPDEITGKTDYDFFPKELADKYRADDARIMESGKREDIEEVCVKDEKGLIFHTVKTPIKDEKGITIGILGCSLDITEKVSLQKEAEQSKHLALLGELAAGVGHEINNPITGVINCAQILFNKSQEGSREKDLASRIIREGDRIAKIVHSLLSFARPGSKEKKGAASVHGILSDTLILTEAQLRKDSIKLKVDIPRKLPEIIANPQLIQQVFLNVINNARYALNQKYPEPHDNKIMEITGEEIMMNGYPYVKVTFCDRGTGIPASIKEKVMNPFVTTKPGGKGTGLGLSLSNNIVKDHKGRLMIDSVEGEFTRVTIILPAKTA